MKKSSALLSAAFALSAMTAFANPFTDVPKGHWAYDAVAKLSENGFFERNKADVFKGDDPVTRYQFSMAVAHVLAKAEQAAEKGSSLSKDSEDLKALKKLTVEFADELSLLGVKVSSLESELENIKADVATIEADLYDIKHANVEENKLRISGDMLVKHVDIVDGVPAGQNTAAAFRLRLDADINERVSAAVRGVFYADEYGTKLGGAAGSSAFPAISKKQNDVDIAYLQIKDVLNGTVVLGRRFLTHGAAVVLSNYADALTYKIRSGKIDVAVNAINSDIRNASGIAVRKDRYIWNLALDSEYAGHKLYAGYYTQTYGYNDSRERSAAEFGARGDITRNGKFSYEADCVLTDVDADRNYKTSPNKHTEGVFYRAVVAYDGGADWNFKLGYMAGDDEFTLKDGISRDYGQRVYGGPETPFDDFANINNKRYRDMCDAGIASCQVGYNPKNSKHAARVAYYKYEQEQDTAKFHKAGLTEDDEADIMVVEYKYKLAPNTGIRTYYTWLDDKTANNTKDELVAVEICSKF